ncbi:sensor histidine kinase [Deinococcus sonorensis]|uniref:histidine kinase n=1 Tax=Deinococcus sonorensis KR-87 TaxID=694439 RepID=A0AAU7UF47_9DEIO
MDRPYDTGAPYYQDHYDPATTSVVRDEVSVIRSSASFPVRQGAVTRGVLVVGLHELRPWSSIERVLLETIVRSLGLALERAESVSHLAEERGKLRAANEELEAFAYSVSHDLRAPVRHMIGFIQLLRRHLGDLPDARAARYLTVVEEAAGRMNVLIDALLELSRTSRADLRLERVDLNALVAGVQADLEPDLQHRRVTWDVALMPAVTGDVELLRQVMTNLLDNALKYTRTQNPAVIRVWAEDRDHEWAVLVSDNGAGFDPRNAPKLFGVFQRLHRQEDYEGVGVGLANVRRIITRHQGSVFAQGAVDHGATFGFTLPKTVVNSGALSSA